MLRPYNTSRFLDIVEMIRVKMPDAAIGTDLIVGFPGETEEDHAATCRVLEEGPFTYVHVFPYSDRPGTAATGMGGKVSPVEISRRSAELREIGQSKLAAFRHQHNGRPVSLLTLSDKQKGCREGLTGNYLKALVPREIPGNRLVRGPVSGIDGEYLLVGDVEFL
jgi:threonylcarbamoyladenosine tRNA methylthiotransferase MtaB